MQTKLKFDNKSVEALFAKLSDPAARESLASRIAIRGAKIVRDEAKMRVPVGVAEARAMAQVGMRTGGSKNPGLLKASIYARKSDARSTDKQIVYSVTWNSRTAPHGHLVEFGYIQRYRVYFNRKTMRWVTDKKKPGRLVRVGARPFLGPAYAARKQVVIKAMLARAQGAFQEIVKNGR